MLRQRDFPKLLAINGTEWTVQFTRFINYGSPKEAAKTIGLCDPETQTILIRQKLKPVQRLAVLFHEVAHAFENEYEREIPHDIVYLFGEAMAAFMVDNDFLARAPDVKPSRLEGTTRMVVSLTKPRRRRRVQDK